MNRLLIPVLFFLCITTLYSQNLKTYFTIGNVGIDNLEEGFKTDNGYISLPGCHIRELDTGLGFSIESLKFNKAFTGESIYTTWFHSTLYWSPIDFNNSTILGPFLDVDFNFHESLRLLSNTGIKLSLYHPVSSFFPEFNVPESIMLNSLNIIAGYSISNESMYFTVSTDLSVLGLMFFKKQDEIAKEMYDIN